MGVIAIDWSGAKQPKAKLWLAEVNRGELRRLLPLSSREEAAAEIIRYCKQTHSAIIGLDFAFSMPAWFLATNRLSTAFDLWALAEKEGERWLNECPPPFWGRPGRRKPVLQTHYRRTEEEVERINGIKPKSVFQVGGAGAVGTGSIRGMPMLRRIHDAGISIWPFDSPSLPMVVEIYPRLLTGEVNKRSLEARKAFIDHPSRKWMDLPAGLRREVARSEDSFDAAVSALVMARHRHELEQLRSVSEEPYHLEGVIWAPRQMNRFLGPHQEK